MKETDLVRQVSNAACQFDPICLDVGLCLGFA